MVLLMARPTKLQGSRFLYARKVVPKDVRAILGRTEFKAPLRGEGRAEIARQHAELIAGWEAQIAAARAQLRGDLRSLTQREISALCGEWYRARIAEYEDEPGDAYGWEATLDYLLSLLPEEEDGEHIHLEPAFAPTKEWLEKARGLLQARGIAADATSIERLAAALWDAEVKLCRTMLRRSRGDYSPDEFLRQFPAERCAEAAQPENRGQQDRRTALPAKELLEAWAAETKPAPATRRKYTIAFGHVSRLLGFDDVRRLRPEDVVTFKTKRLAEGRDTGTVADDVLACGAVCNWAVKNRILESNPFAGLAPKVNRRGPAPRAPYDDNEAARILIAARAESGWLRWLPWLLCFTGARISELVELRRGDVRQEGGIWLLDVKPTDRRQGKNATFQRLLPLHPAVIAEGFLDYVASLPADPESPLFPSIPPDPRGSRVNPATTKLGRWIRKKVGITDPKKAPAHSWRHRMEDELRKVRALPEIQDAITGRHNPRNAGAGYGRGFRGMPGEVLKELRKVPSPCAIEETGATDAVRCSSSDLI